jgi:hypothetical protein
MFIDNAVIKEFEGERRYDKFAIASTLFDVSFKGATCSVMVSQSANNCDACELNYLCNRVDEIIEEYIDKTTMVTDTFNFGS